MRAKVTATGIDRGSCDQLRVYARELLAEVIALRARIARYEPRRRPRPDRTPIEPTPEAHQILQETAAQYGLTVEALVGFDRRRWQSEARHVACYRIRTELRYPLDQIGRMFSGRDHTTILNSCRRAEELLAGNVSQKESTHDARGNGHTGIDGHAGGRPRAQQEPRSGAAA